MLKAGDRLSAVAIKMTIIEQQQAAPPNLAKLTVPRMECAFGRARLFEHIDRARRDSRLLWVGAEAGSGKTTLAVSYLETSQLNSLWYQLDEGDADTASFFYYMDQAARGLALGHRTLPMLTPEYLGAVEVYARNFFRELFSLFQGRPGVLVFDNYQDLPDASPLHQLLVAASEELPPGLSIVVLSREAPPAAFARLFANGQATAIEAPELRLTIEETGEISTLYVGKAINKEQVESLHQQTGGWAAGVRLMLNQLQSESSEPLIKDTQPPEIIFDYFAAEVLQRVDEATQDFLMRSALLPTMTIETARELTGNSRASEIMGYLVRQNYFMVSHGGDMSVYEYHDLFRQFLIYKGRERFPASERQALVQDAAVVLIRAGQYEHAAELLVEIADHDALQALIERYAPALAAQGRLITLENWLQTLPAERIQSQPWLGYWLGYCRMPRDLFGARSLFECAYVQFKEERQPLGQYLAWSGVAETFQYSWDDFSGIDSWVEELHGMQNEHPLEQIPDAGPRVICAALGMLSFVRSDSPEVNRLVGQAESLLVKLRGSSLHIFIAATLQLHYGWIGDMTKIREITGELQQYVDTPALEPLAKLYGYLALTESGWLIGDLELARERGLLGLEYGEHHGIVMFKPLFHAQLSFSYQLLNDLESAKEQIEQLSLCTQPERRLDVAHYHYHAAWVALEEGELAQARGHLERSLALTEMLQACFPAAMNRIKLAEVLVVCGEYDAVSPLLDQAETFAGHIGSPMLRFMVGLVRAFALLRAGHTDNSASVLSAAMGIGRGQGYTTYPGQQGRYIAELCCFALERDIEVDYVRTLIRKRGLLPPPGERVPEAWPWAVKIYTLGGFEVVREGEQLQFTTKVQKKPLELLQALIALGGCNVSTLKLGELLWPDADGDAAQQNLKATLHRLRKLIGHDAVDVQDNRMGLSPRYCWTDIDALSGLLNRIPDGVTGTDDESEQRLAARMLELYRGSFLSDQEASWVLVPREVFRGKFLKAMKQVAGRLCEQGNTRVALDYYYKLLDIEPLREDIYVAVMRCYQSIGQLSEAMGVYQQLCTLLDSQPGFEPSPEVQELYQSIVSQQA